MKNFWIGRHNQKQQQNKIKSVQDVIADVIQRRLGIFIRNMPWIKNKP